jgi:hypothetical protein
VTDPVAPIRVLIADDQQVVRAGFAALLDTRDDITVVGTARDGEDAINVATTNRPDVVLMDVRMPVLDGIAQRSAAGRRRTRSSRRWAGATSRMLVVGVLVAGRRPPRRALPSSLRSSDVRTRRAGAHQIRQARPLGATADAPSVREFGSFWQPRARLTADGSYSL